LLEPRANGDIIQKIGYVFDQLIWVWSESSISGVPQSNLWKGMTDYERRFKTFGHWICFLKPCDSVKLHEWLANR
jgi:hypothetical protein